VPPDAPPHDPAVHGLPTAQTVPQEPQFVASVCVFTQLPPHEVSGAVHVEPMQLPPLHV
jgi:hypothetical protein